MQHLTHHCAMWHLVCHPDSLLLLWICFSPVCVNSALRLPPSSSGRCSESSPSCLKPLCPWAGTEGRGWTDEGLRMEGDRVASVLAPDFGLESSSLAALSGVPRGTKAQLRGPDGAGGAVPWSGLMGPLGIRSFGSSCICVRQTGTLGGPGRTAERSGGWSPAAAGAR